MAQKDFVLSVEDLTVSFDGFKAVDGLNLYVDRNEVRVVIGPNGAGKTTVLDLISGKTRATGGSIKFKGLELTKMSEHMIVRAGIGRKFQTPSIYENLTTYENLEVSFPRGRSVFGAIAFRRTADVDERVRQIAEEVFLTEMLDQTAELLSHGQKQWLEIGMLLMQNPELLLVDEPVAGMTDAETRQTAELLREINREHTIVVVEHDMTFVRDLGVKVTCLHEGSVLAEGTIDQVSQNERVVEVYLGR